MRHIIFTSLLVSVAWAQNEAGYAPEAVIEEDFENIAESSPFTRPLNIAESLTLAGLANIDGRPVATLIDEKTKEVHVITDEPNVHGWRIVEVSRGGGLERLTATISVSGSEITTLRFQEDRLKPTKERIAGGSQKNQVKKDTRPPPTQEERRKFGEYLGKRMKNYTDEQKKRVGEIMREKQKEGMSDRQKGELLLKILDHVEKEGRK
ncbi:MAG: hypothetical protein AAF585_25245 [Verrucomicrobiota bacterium]